MAIEWIGGKLLPDGYHILSDTAYDMWMQLRNEVAPRYEQYRGGVLPPNIYYEMTKSDLSEFLFDIHKVVLQCATGYNTPFRNPDWTPYTGPGSEGSPWGTVSNNTNFININNWIGIIWWIRDVVENLTHCEHKLLESEGKLVTDALDTLDTSYDAVPIASNGSWDTSAWTPAMPTASVQNQVQALSSGYASWGGYYGGITSFNLNYFSYEEGIPEDPDDPHAYPMEWDVRISSNIHKIVIPSFMSGYALEEAKFMGEAVTYTVYNRMDENDCLADPSIRITASVRLWVNNNTLYTSPDTDRFDGYELWSYEFGPWNKTHGEQYEYPVGSGNWYYRDELKKSPGIIDVTTQLGETVPSGNIYLKSMAKPTVTSPSTVYTWGFRHDSSHRLYNVQTDDPVSMGLHTSAFVAQSRETYTVVEDAYPGIRLRFIVE